MHALFNKNAAKNTWTIGAMTLRSFIEYFGVGTEQLDISSEGGRTTFMSYTEKVMNGRGDMRHCSPASCAADVSSDVLKQPLQTSVTIDNLDFEDFNVEGKLHIGISVKDFKAIATHADTLKTSITALYSFPNRPMQLSYRGRGILCEFTLMTIGDYRGESATPAPSASRQASATVQLQPPSRQDSKLPTIEHQTTTMPPPSQPASRSFNKEPLLSQRTQRPSPPPPKASLDPESLFLPQYDDEDRQWGERNFDEEEDTVGWSANTMKVLLLCQRIPEPALMTLIEQESWKWSRSSGTIFTTTTIFCMARGGSRSFAANTATITSM